MKQPTYKMERIALANCKPHADAEAYSASSEDRAAQVAARIGRSKSHIWRVLKGQRKPGKELAEVLNEMGFEVEVS